MRVKACLLGIFFVIFTVIYPVNMERRVDLNLNTTLEKSFEIISKLSGMSIIMDDSVLRVKRVNLSVKEMSVEKVFGMILQLNDLSLKTIDETTVIVYPRSKEKIYYTEETEIFFLDNIKAETMSGLLRANMGLVKVYVDSRMNSLSITASEKKLSKVKKLIKKYDNDSLFFKKTYFLSYLNLEKAKELLDKHMYIADFSMNESQNSITISGRKKDLEKADTLISSLDRKKDQVTVDILLIDASEGFKRSLGFDFDSTIKVGTDALYKIFDPQLLTASETKAKVEILSKPSIRVLDDEKAYIKIGEQVPILTALPVENTESYSAIPDVEYRDVGILLDVEPDIHRDNEVTINIGLEVSSVGEVTETDYGSYPSFETKNINTLVRLKSGETVIFGGLISDEERESIVSIPYVGDIPVVGRLFQKKTEQPQKSEIMMLITPRIISESHRSKGREGEDED